MEKNDLHNNVQIRPLKKLVQKIRTEKSISGIREDYQLIVDRLLNITKLDKIDIENLDNDENLKNLSARVEKVKKILDSTEVAQAHLSVEEIESLASEIFSIDESIHQQIVFVIEKLLHNELYAYNNNSYNNSSQGQGLGLGLGHFEFILKNFSSLTDIEVQSLKAKGILNEQDFLSTDPLDLISITGRTSNTVMELIYLFNEYSRIKEAMQITEKVLAIHKANRQLMSEIERLTSSNNVLIESNRNLQSKYEQILPVHAKKIEEMKNLQNKVTTSQIECNRLAMEINFLKDERYKLSMVAEEKHIILGKLLKRIDSIKKGHDFMKGETVFSEDMLLHLESLLGDALNCGQKFGEKLEDTKTSLETLFSELNETIKKGKLIFYKELKQM
ncbi:MAG: hypothetical protein HQK51_21060 [Oligoflexia bacterium]|nr:hypothetical protein [Oligoflexia bacterium]